MTLTERAQASSARVWLGALLVFALSCAVLLSAFAYDFFPLQPDETTLAWQSKLAREGYLPYRDYFAYKPPIAIYLPAAVFAAFGSSLAALRFFFIATLAGTTVLLYLLCVRTRMGAGWAGIAALALPALFVPYWPVASAHWLALGFGLGALLTVSSPTPSWRATFVAGLFAALAGLCVQTHGVLFAGLLAIRLLSDPLTRGRSKLVAAVIGVIVPLLAASTLLWYAGVLEEALRHIVLWPLQYYRQPGGFNDVPTGAAAPGSIEWTPGLVLNLLRFSLVAAVPAGVTAGSVLMWRRGARGARGNFALLGTLLLWFVFLEGRADFVHLVFLTAIWLYLLMQHLDWNGVRRSHLMRASLVAVALLMLRWPLYWLSAPPGIEAVAGVDVRWAREGVPSVLAELPEAGTGDLPVLYLGTHGSALYLYWAPLPPPVDWLQPPEDRYNSPAEFQLVADFAQRHEVPYIVLQVRTAEAWMRDPSPVRDVLSEHYRRAFETSWGTAYCRLDAVVPSTGAAVCDLPRPSP